MKKRLLPVLLLCVLLAVAAAIFFLWNHKKDTHNQMVTTGMAASSPEGPPSGAPLPMTSLSPETAKALQALQDPNTPEADKIRIITDLGKQKEPGTFPGLLALLGRGQEKIRMEAALALARFDKPDLRLQALERIQSFCPDERLKSGIKVLKEADRHVDLQELKALAAHPSPVFVHELLALYAFDENRDVRLSVIEWLPPQNSLTKQSYIHLLKDEEFQKTDELRLALFFALKPWKEDQEVIQCITENFDKEHYPDWM